MYRYMCVIVPILLLVTQLDAVCNRINNVDLIEYNCEGGSTDDLKLIPSSAEKIRISNMSVGRINKDLFSRFGNNLVVLTCSHCLVTDINEEAFQKLQNLQQLSLDNNYLTEIKAEWFDGLAYLTYLDFNYNHIERISSDVFQNIPDIVDLRLSGNRLLCLDLESMSKLHDLKRIFLNDNPNFGCPNTMKKFLTERNIDYEADPHWSIANIVDQMPINKPSLPIQPGFIDLMNNTVIVIQPTTAKPSLRPQVPTFSSSASNLSPITSPTYYTRRVTETPSWSVTTPISTSSPRPSYIQEIINPSVPEQSFTYQDSYYAPEVTQQLDNYKNTAIEQIESNKSIEVTTTSTMTECLNTASHFSMNLILLITLIQVVTIFING